ncbi:hypothetical protein HHI36_008219 [Cryptolaemus montrouzieri]|uniref:Uncharacterized protein n=1 Tax=Cryptolaemus montrouzieri TaxID=559131 RepID=A0ABD2MRR8_9CUCU
MKFLVLFLATAALASASLIGRKAVDVQEDGTIIIKGENGKQILISKEYGPYGQKNIEIEVTGPNTVTKKIQIDDQNQVNIEHGVEYHIPSTYDDVRSFEVNRYRRSFMDQSQNDIFSEIVREYQGVVDEESYQELLDQVQKAVVQGRISSNVLYFLQALNEYSNELLSSGYGYNNLYTKNNNNYYGKGVYEQQKYGRFFKNLFFQGQQGVMYHQDSQQFLRNVLIQIFDQRYLFNYLSQQGVFYRGTYEQESLENVLEYFLNNQGIFDKTFLIELLNTPVLRNILVEEGIFNKSIVQQIMYVFSTQRTYDQELLEQLVNKQALKYQLINQGIFQNYVFTQFVVKDVLTTGLYQNEFYGQEQLVQMVKNRALRQILVQQGIFNENVVYKLLVALKSQRSYTQTLLSQLVNKQVLRNILIQQGIVDYTVLDQLVNNEIMGLNVLLKTKFYQQTPRTSYKQLFGFASNLPEFSYGQIQGYPYGQNFVGINFEKTIVKPVDQEYQR